jgi:hypothetical protein
MNVRGILFNKRTFDIKNEGIGIIIETSLGFMWIDIGKKEKRVVTGML